VYRIFNRERQICRQYIVKNECAQDIEVGIFSGDYKIIFGDLFLFLQGGLTHYDMEDYAEFSDE
jgi:hypothetical protein